MGCASSQPVAPKPKTPALRGVHAGVQLGWLKQFVKQVPPGMVHARVGQIVLVCDESKTKSVRPTEARARGRNSSRGRHSSL